MKIRLQKSTTLLISLVVSGLFLVTLSIAVALNARSAAAQNYGGTLITLYDRGTETAFVTDKPTLREAFSERGIPVDAKDAVEPSLDEQLVATEYHVNIYRARPVTVIDGATKRMVVTPYQSASRIAEDAGVALYPEDVATLSRSTNILTDGAGLQLAVDRATPILLNLYGTTTEVRTQATTVGDMLKEKNIDLGVSGRISVPGSTSIVSGLELRVWREGKQTITTDEAVAFETEQIKDADRQVGYKAVQTPGKEGKRTVTYEITIQDGVEVARTEIASIVLEQPVKQVEIVGSKPATLPYTGGGTKSEWLAASNIPQESWGYADFMVSKESGWNPNAVNKSSGACGLAQALPCSKVPGNPYNPIDSLNWMNGYVNGRYGGWEQAYSFWQRNRWY
jgi:uncharacterized protein YabE (DUF348 family)